MKGIAVCLLTGAAAQAQQLRNVPNLSNRPGFWTGEFGRTSFDRSMGQVHVDDLHATILHLLGLD